MIDESTMSEALDAVHEEALKLARRDDLPEGVPDGLNLIILLSRHKANVRSQREKEAAESASGLQGGGGRREEVSADKPRRAGEPVYRKPESGLRLVKSPEARPRPAPDPELKALLDEVKRRHPGRRVRIERGPGDKDAA